MTTLILAQWFSFKFDMATDAVSPDIFTTKSYKKDAKKGPSLKHLVSLSQMDMGSKTISAKSTKMAPLGLPWSLFFLGCFWVAFLIDSGCLLGAMCPPQGSKSDPPDPQNHEFLIDFTKVSWKFWKFNDKSMDVIGVKNHGGTWTS